MITRDTTEIDGILVQCVHPVNARNLLFQTLDLKETVLVCYKGGRQVALWTLKGIERYFGL